MVQSISHSSSASQSYLCEQIVENELIAKNRIFFAMNKKKKGKKGKKKK